MLYDRLAVVHPDIHPVNQVRKINQGAWMGSMGSIPTKLKTPHLR